MKIKKLLFVAFALFTALTTRGQSKMNENAFLEEAKKAIAQSNAIHFDLYAKNDGSVVKLFAEDACILVPNAPILCGHDGIAKFFKDAYEAGGVRSGKITTLHVY